MTAPRVDLREIEARLAAASPSPWWIAENDGSIQRDAKNPTGEVYAELVGEMDSDRDADFVAHAPEDLAACLAALREARELLRMVTLEEMGGEPDLFRPAGGWESWHEHTRTFLTTITDGEPGHE